MSEPIYKSSLCKLTPIEYVPVRKEARIYTNIIFKDGRYIPSQEYNEFFAKNKKKK